MAKGIVQQVIFNVQKTAKSGKTYNVIQLKYTTEKGLVKTEDIFENAAYANVVKGLAPGDEVEVIYVKNGNFFNVTDIKQGTKGTGVAPSVPPQSKGYTPRVEDPEKQASIQRQNALTNATNLVSAMIAQEMFKKTTKPNILIDEILKIATSFEGYTSGKDKIEKLVASIPSIASDDSDAPFETSAFPE